MRKFPPHSLRLSLTICRKVLFQIWFIKVSCMQSRYSPFLQLHEQPICTWISWGYCRGSYREVRASHFFSAVWPGSLIWDGDREPVWGETVQGFTSDYITDLHPFQTLFISLVLSLITASRLLHLSRPIDTASSTLTLATTTFLDMPQDSLEVGNGIHVHGCRNVGHLVLELGWD